MRNAAFQGFFSFLERGATHNPQPFVVWLEALLTAKIGSQTNHSMDEITLREFYEINGHHLSLLAADITNPAMLILNHFTAPDCPLVQAVRMATAAPLFFPPVVWNEKWGMVGKRELVGDLIVDGGVLSNFPIELFLSSQEMTTKIIGEPDKNSGVLGLLLDESQAIPGAPSIPESTLQKNLNLLPGYALTTKLIWTVIEARDKRARETVENFVVHLPVRDIAPFVISLSPESVKLLINASYNAMITHLEKHGPGNLRFDEVEQRQVDKTAAHIINVFGNLINVHQEVHSVSDSGSVVGVKIGE
jgi:predicted acylesterase/phospholipase RssA